MLIYLVIINHVGSFLYKDTEYYIILILFNFFCKTESK